MFYSELFWKARKIGIVVVSILIVMELVFSGMMNHVYREKCNAENGTYSTSVEYNYSTCIKK